jgi:hypothetical protein
VHVSFSAVRVSMKSPTEIRTSAQVYFVFIFVFLFRLAAMHDVLLEIPAFAQIWDTQCDGIYFFVLISANAKIEKLWGTTNGSMILRRCDNRARARYATKKYRKHSRKKAQECRSHNAIEGTRGSITGFLLCYWFHDMIDCGPSCSV